MIIIYLLDIGFLILLYKIELFLKNNKDKRTSKQMDSNLDFHHAKMNFMMELDNQIRYYRSGIVKYSTEETEAIKQYIVFMTTCKKLNMINVEFEKIKLKRIIGNMMYEALESGILSQQFSVIWTTTVRHVHMYYNKCYLLCELMEGIIDPDEYKKKDTKNNRDMIESIQGDVSLETLEILVAP